LGAFATEACLDFCTKKLSVFDILYDLFQEKNYYLFVGPFFYVIDKNTDSCKKAKILHLLK
jgi:hypothetical protein